MHLTALVPYYKQTFSLCKMHNCRHITPLNIKFEILSPVNACASPGSLFSLMKLSMRQKPKPKNNGWPNASKSPNPGTLSPPNSKHPTPAVATRAGKRGAYHAPFLLELLFLGNRASSIGTTITANEHMNATVDASVVTKADACV